MEDSFAAWLKHTTVGDVMACKTRNQNFDTSISIVDISEQEPLFKALNLLSSYGLQFIPVYSSNQPIDKQYLYWLGSLEIAAFIGVTSLNEHDDKFLDTTIKAVHDTLEKHSWVPCDIIDQSESLKAVLYKWESSVNNKECPADSLYFFYPFLVKISSDSSTSSSSTAVLSVFSQIDFLRYFFLTSSQRFPKLYETGSSEVKGSNKFLKVRVHESALATFCRVALPGESCHLAAIIDDSGSMIMHLSPTDLLCDDSSRLYRSLHLPVAAYLSLCRGKQPSSIDIFTLNPRYTLGELLKKILSYAVHQLWRWEQFGEGVPKEVVTAAHIVHFLASQVE